jgi:hypothetical protein
MRMSCCKREFEFVGCWGALAHQTTPSFTHCFTSITACTFFCATPIAHCSNKYMHKTSEKKRRGASRGKLLRPVPCTHLVNEVRATPGSSQSQCPPRTRPPSLARTSTTSHKNLRQSRAFNQRNGITPPRRGPLVWLHFAALLNFSMYKIIWPVVALACGSLHTVVTFLRAKRLTHFILTFLS